MFFDLAVSTAFIVSFLTFWYLQIFTRKLSTRYYLQVALLSVISLSSAYLVLRLLAFEQSWAMLLGVVGMGAVFIYHTGLVVAKFLVESDSRYRRIHKANRAIVSYNEPHERLTLNTDDGVRLQAIALVSGATRNKREEAVCPGAGRNNDTIASV